MVEIDEERGNKAHGNNTWSPAQGEGHEMRCNDRGIKGWGELIKLIKKLSKFGYTKGKKNVRMAPFSGTSIFYKGELLD